MRKRMLALLLTVAMSSSLIAPVSADEFIWDDEGEWAAASEWGDEIAWVEDAPAGDEAEEWVEADEADIFEVEEWTADETEENAAFESDDLFALEDAAPGDDYEDVSESEPSLEDDALAGSDISLAAAEEEPGSSVSSAIELEDGREIFAEIQDASQDIYFKFSVPWEAPRRYEIYSTGDADTKAELFVVADDGTYEYLVWNDDFEDGGNFKISYYLEGGETYYIKVSRYAEPEIATFGIIIKYVDYDEAAVAGAIELEAGQEVSAELADASQDIYFKFSVPEDASGEYVVFSTGDADTNAELFVLADDGKYDYLMYNDDYGDRYNFSISYDLEGGKTYYIKVERRSEPEIGTFGIIIKEVDYEEVFAPGAIELEVGREVLAELDDASQDIYFKFSVPEDASGPYKVYSTGDADTNAELFAIADDGMYEYLASDDDHGDWENFRIRYDLEGGKTYYIKVNRYGYPEIGTFGIILEYDDYDEEAAVSGAIELEAGREMLAELADASQELYFKFTAPGDASRRYEVYSTGDADTKAELLVVTEDRKLEGLARDDDYGEGNNFSIDYYLEGGKTYYIKVKRRADPEIGTFGIILKYADYDEAAVSDAIELEVGEEVFAELADASQELYFKFSVSEDMAGWYKVCSTGDADTYAELFVVADDGKYECLDEDDVYGEGFNFSIRYPLEGGETYYLKVNRYADPEIGRFGIILQYDDIVWNFADGVLTVSGSGVMDFPDGIPWSDYDSSISSVVITEGVISVEASAFRFDSSLTSVDISAPVLIIDESAFAYCRNLETISLPASVVRIEDEAFYFCSALKTIEFAGTKEDWNNIYFGERAFLTAGATVKCSDGDIVIAPTCYRSGVSADGLEWILDDGVFTISGSGDMAGYFYYETTLPDWSDFSEEITKVVVREGITSIGSCAFLNCYNLKEVVLPEGITSIGGYAFSGCDNLTAIRLPGTIDEIQIYAFEGCRSLREVVFNGTQEQWDHIVIDSIGNDPLYAAELILMPCASGHTVVEDEAIEATCTDEGKTKGSHCSVCYEVLVPQERIPSLGHNYEETVVPATLDSDGSITCACTVCGDIEWESTILKVANIKLAYTSKAYTAKQQKPAVTVENAAGYPLEPDIDYTVSYGENKKIGQGTVTVTLQGEYYSGEKTLKFKILPITISGVKATVTSSGAVKLTWNRPAATAWSKVYRAESPDGPWKLVKKIESNTYYEYSTDKHDAGKTYYYRVLAYKVIDGVFYVAKNYSPVVSIVQPKPGKTLLNAPVSSASKTISLGWSEVVGASGYEIRRATSSNGTYSLVKTITSGTTLKYANTGLTKGKTYYYKVRAYKVLNGKKVYGPYSSVKKCVVKK